LKEDRKKIEELLKNLETQKKEVDEKYSSALEEENKIHEQLRKCRDTYQYSRLEMRLNILSRRRREIESQKQAIDRKIIGHREELKKTSERIEYMRPKGKLIPHHKEK
jgi:uncharacterized protein (DUF3084 family)